MHYLVFVLQEITEAVEKIRNGEQVTEKWHIGRGNIVCVNSDFNTIDFRRYWMNPAHEYAQPTTRGTSRKISQWENLKSLIQDMMNKYFTGDRHICQFDGDDELAPIHVLPLYECVHCKPFGNETKFDKDIKGLLPWQPSIPCVGQTHRIE